MNAHYSHSKPAQDLEIPEIIHDNTELRPTTPLETSQSEPLLSKSSSVGHAPSSPTPLGGTYRIGDDGRYGNIGLVGVAMGGAMPEMDELEVLNESALESKKQLTAAEERLVQLG